MKTPPEKSSRRDILKTLSRAPLFPITLSGIGGALVLPQAALASVKIKKAEFSHVPVPKDIEAMAKTTVDSKLTLTYEDNRQDTFELAYETFFITGKEVPDGKGGYVIAGGSYDHKGVPIPDTSTSDHQPFFSDCPDGMSLITLKNPKVPGAKGNTVFAVVQFEHVSKNAKGDNMYKRLPSAIAVLTLDQDKETGKLSLVKYSSIDTSPAHGLWVTCGASLSPWNTHLSSEEFEPDATQVSKELKSFSQHYFGDEKKANPYHYGHLPEITVHPDGTGTVTKHYCLGRISHELIQVMPDERTVLMGDDFTNGGLFMFIADKARDLSSGSLYVAKWHPLSTNNGGSAILTWLKLGSTRSQTIEEYANTLTVDKVMDVKWEDPGDQSYTKIDFNGAPNWVKLVPGKEIAAAFLETHRYAALVGGSMGFTKMEGTTVNVRDKIAYSAISSIKKPMANYFGLDTCIAGAIYQLHLRGDQFDEQGNKIDSAWVPVDMSAIPELVGKDIPPDAFGNTADPERLGNPDNIKFSENLRTLFIGEDSDGHANNFLWAFNVDTRELRRVLSIPSGAESTGLHAVDEVNGFTYITSNFQHAGEFPNAMPKELSKGIETKLKENYGNTSGRLGAAVGYLTYNKKLE